jgi:type VII secretion integral membrane protein EccD
MSATTVAPRRVTVVAPTARVDIALPAQSTVAELLPQLVQLTTGEPQAGAGWSLARLGGRPFDPGATVAGAGIHDGDLVYLNPREHDIGPLLFDDVVDAIAHAAAQRAGTWRAQLSRRVGLASAMAALAGLAALIAVAGLPSSALILGTLAVILLITAGSLARAFGDADAGAALAVGGLPAALLAGMEAVNGGGHPLRPTAAALAVGCGAVLVASVVSAIAVAHRTAVFTGVAVAASAGGLAAAATIVTGARPASVAAVTVVLSIVFSPALPMLAVRIGRLPLPRIPTDAAAFRADERPTLGPEVVDGTRAAQAVLTGLLGAVSAVAFAGTVGVTGWNSPWTMTLGAVAGFALLLRSRAYVSVGQRGVLMLGGTGGLLVTAARVVSTSGTLTRAGLAAAVLATAVFCLVHALRGTGKGPSPYWSRLLDVAEFLALIALVPVAAAVLDVFAAVRSLGG